MLPHGTSSGGGAEDVSCNFNKRREILPSKIKWTHSMNCASCDIFCKVIIVDKDVPAHIIAAERKFFISKLLPNGATCLLGDRLIPCPLFEASSLWSSSRRAREPVLKITGEEISSYHKPEATIVDWGRGTEITPWQVWVRPSLTHSCPPRHITPHSSR